MMHGEKRGRTFYGTTVLGEKGQVVIPVEARGVMKLKKGERLLVFGFNGDMLAFARISHMERFAAHLSKKLALIQRVIRRTKRRK